MDNLQNFNIKFDLVIRFQTVSNLHRINTLLKIANKKISFRLCKKNIIIFRNQFQLDCIKGFKSGLKFAIFKQKDPNKSISLNIIRIDSQQHLKIIKSFLSHTLNLFTLGRNQQHLHFPFPSLPLPLPLPLPFALAPQCPCESVDSLLIV